MLEQLIFGAVRVFDPSGVVTREPSGYSSVSDTEALRGDWERVGDDLALSIRRLGLGAPLEDSE